MARKCTLCGSRLDRNKICTECGLDNTKNDDRYIFNRSACEDEPLTHVHTERTMEERDWKSRKVEDTLRRKPKKEKKPKTERQRQKDRQIREGRTKKRFGCLPIVFIVISLLSGIIPAAIDLFSDVTSETFSIFEDMDYLEEDMVLDIDPYEYLEQTLPEADEYGGEGHAEYTLDSGEYVVGVHIPAGYYVAETYDDYDVVSVSDFTNGIYLYEYTGKEEMNYLDDLRLFPGATVTIDAENPVLLVTENAQTNDMWGMENPLNGVVTGPVLLFRGEQAKAGEGFEAGVYDVAATGGWGYLKLVIYGEDGTVYSQKQVAFDVPEDGEAVYRNLVIPEGTLVECVEDIEVTLTPSPWIESEDYLDSYLY